MCSVYGPYEMVAVIQRQGTLPMDVAVLVYKTSTVELQCGPQFSLP